MTWLVVLGVVTGPWCLCRTFDRLYPPVAPWFIGVSFRVVEATARAFKRKGR